MSSRAEALKLGPFTGGMNAASDLTTVSDSELVDCVNFELDLDGSLIQRPPLKQVADLGTGHPLNAIGNCVTTGGTSLIIFSGSDGTYSFDGANFTLIKAGLTSKVALQYRDLIYIVATAGSAQAGGYWNPATTTFTTQATMPRGEGAIFNKSRMFIVPGVNSAANTSRLQFSDSITADVFVWTATNIIDVNPGDGQKLVDLVVYNDNLMLFKEDSTYVLAYDLQISDAVLRNVNPNIGSSGPWCVTTYENSVYVFHEGKVFEINNYDFNHINAKVPFVYDAATPAGNLRAIPIFLCLMGDRLVVRYFNRVYVYGLKTKTWSRWDSLSNHLRNFGPLVDFPINYSEETFTKYYSGSTLDQSSRVYVTYDGRDTLAIYKEQDSTGLIVIESSILTKNYDINDSFHYKKLMWWGADLLTNQEILAYATPVVNPPRAYWSDLAGRTWNSISLNTWAAPLLDPVLVTTDVIQATVENRKFVKFRKAMRFRQINFKLILKGDGSVNTGPARLFTLTAIANAKQLVSKQVT